MVMHNIAWAFVLCAFVPTQAADLQPAVPSQPIIINEPPLIMREHANTFISNEQHVDDSTIVAINLAHFKLVDNRIKISDNNDNTTIPLISENTE